MLNRNNLIVIAIAALLLMHGGVIPAPSISGLLPATTKPIALEGLNVLIVTDRSEGSSPQVAWLTSGEFRQQLRSAAAAVYVWDDSHSDFRFVDPAWERAYQAALSESQGVRPWIVVSGRGGTSQRLPDTAAATLELVRRYAP